MPYLYENLMSDFISDIRALRHELHQHPELSNQEYQTAERISHFFKDLNPDQEVRVGKTGRAFVFSGRKPGKTVLFRAELDALPVREQSSKPYQSLSHGVAHVCGHDGHMAILAGLAKRVALERPVHGRVVLLFQPAEEVEQGARDVVEDPRFRRIEPDWVFALHNIPGAALHEVIVRECSFAAASKGMTIQLHGKTSHAAEPENGISPASAISRIIPKLHDLTAEPNRFKDLTLLTIIHIRMGEVSFGTSPGYAEIMVTLRSFENDDMDTLTSLAVQTVRQIAEEEKLGCDISFNEVFPATVNDPRCNLWVRQAAESLNLSVTEREQPFKWSEDFAYFTQKYPGALFGLGAGLNQPQLHNPNYDFPDAILETGINLFHTVYRITQNTSTA